MDNPRKEVGNGIAAHYAQAVFLDATFVVEQRPTSETDDGKRKWTIALARNGDDERWLIVEPGFAW